MIKLIYVVKDVKFVRVDSIKILIPSKTGGNW